MINFFLKFFKFIFLIHFFSIFFTLINPVFAREDAFPAGTENKISAIESSSQTCVSAPAVMYNPANLSLSPKNEPYLELGYLQFSQAYEHPDFDQVRVQVRTPFLSFGYVTSFLEDKLKLGFLFYPSRYVNQHIPGLPRRIAGTFTAFDVRFSQEVYKYGVGFSYSLLPHLFIGTSLLHSYEKQALIAKPIDKTDITLMEYKGKREFNKFALGSRYENDIFSFSTTLSYTPALKKSFNGYQKTATSEERTKPLKVEYEPEIFSFGFTKKLLQDFDLILSLNHLLWSKGKNTIKDGLTSETQRSDLHDITEMGLRIDNKISSLFSYGLSYANLPSPWGNGFFSNDTGNQILGTDFDKTNNVNRNAFGLGCKYLLGKSFNLESGLYYVNGKREVPLSGNNPGFYQTEIIALSASIKGDL